jgi:hypothetical protein
MIEVPVARAYVSEMKHRGAEVGNVGPSYALKMAELNLGGSDEAMWIWDSSSAAL